MITVGACSCISCTAVNCAAPAMITTENPMTWARFSPASVPTTPKSIPKGATTNRKGRAARIPRR